MKSSLLAVAVYGVAADVTGDELKCLGTRAHRVTYDVKGGPTREEVTDATITIQREPVQDAFCLQGLLPPLSDDKNFCFGANTGDDCQGSLGVLPINDNFECSNCFVGVTTDLYYHFALVSQKIELGIRNTQILGSLEMHAHGDAATELTSGSFTLPDKEAKINFMAGSIPVNITISLPTSINYDVGLKGQLEAVAGANVNIDFGEHTITYDKTNGLVATNTAPTFDFAPVLSVDSGDSGANMGVGLTTMLKVDVDNIAWYHINAAANLPQKVTYTAKVGSDDEVCLKADIDIPVSHEAAVHKTVFGLDVVVKHLGPVELFHIQKDEAVNKCVDIPLAAVVV